MKTIPFIIASKGMRYVIINLTKEMKDLYTENYKMFTKKIKDTKNGKISMLMDWKTILSCHY